MDGKSKISQSQIPVKSSRPVQGSLNSSLSIPNFGLVPPPRYPSVGDSPTHPSPTTSSPVQSTSGLPSFRSFRNLLPFGPKSPNVNSPNTSQAGPSKPQFATLGALRRSINGERSVSAPQLRREKSAEEYPVLSIEAPRTVELSLKVNEPLLTQEELGGFSHGIPIPTSPTRRGLGMSSIFRRPSLTSSPNTAATSTSSLNLSISPSMAASPKHHPLPPPSPAKPAVSDLSTIIESETSGISKHLPSPDTSQDAHTARQAFFPGSLSPNSEKEDMDTSVLDLSTSKVSSEVMAALAGQDRWTGGVVIDADSPPLPSSPGVDNSFNLSSLDPDLAALLSPNRLKPREETATLRALDSISPPPLTPPLTASSLRPSPNPSPTISHATPSVLLPSSQSSPRRRSISLSKPKPTINVPSTATPSPRLARSVSDRPPFIRSPASFSGLQAPSPRTSDIGERPASTTPSVLSPPSPLGESALPRRPHTGETEGRRPLISRLLTPNRTPTPSREPSTIRSSFRPPPSAEWNGSEVSRSPSSSAAAIKLSRPSLDGGSERLRSHPRLLGRDRSASVSDSPTIYGTPPGRTDWLGPRTAKAFAAAGLLDKEGSSPSLSRPGSRFGNARSEKDYRSQYTPSRTGFSDVGSALSSWGRRSGSISRTARSEVTSPETVSTPRTTFSGSTAPTSISASSSAQQQLQSEMRIMQEKHSMETTALLSALHDSQRSNKVLREENSELNRRVQDLEMRLEEAMTEIHRLQYTFPAQPQQIPSHSRSNLSSSRLNGSRLADGGIIRKRTQLHQSLMPADMEGYQNGLMEHHHPSPGSRVSLELPRDPDRLSTISSRRRYSNTSSIFPHPPSNMPLLLQEDGLGHDPAFSTHSHSFPSSPTMVLSKLPTQHVPQRSFTSEGSSHHRHNSSNGGNISPTTANFSMLTGSPGSLNLRPEHERLLGDMPSLDLHAESFEGDSLEG